MQSKANKTLFLHLNIQIMEEKKISEKESLELISLMIQKTQRKMEKGMGTPMLIWGGSTVVVTLIVWITIRMTLNYHMHSLWFLIPIIGGIGTWLTKKPSKGVRTYIDKTIAYIWLVLGTTGFIISTLTILNIFDHLPILFIIVTLMGMGAILTGLVAELRPFIIGGILGTILGITSNFVRTFDAQILIFAAAFIIMMIIPGFILNHRARKYV